MIPVMLGLATCFWFYAVLPWEHVPAAALSTAAFAVAVRGRSPGPLAMSGLLLGCAADLRDESLLLLPGLILVGISKGVRPRAILFTLAACALPVVLASAIDQMVYGRPAATHLRHAIDPLRWLGIGVSTELPRIASVPLVRRYDILMHEWLLGFRGIGQSLVLVGVLAVIGLLRRRSLRVWGVLLVVTVLLGHHLRDLHLLLREPDFVPGLLRLSPVLIFAALPLASPGPFPCNRSALLLTTGLFLAGMLVVVNTTGGASLGPRLLIPVLPLMVVAAWEGLESYWDSRHCGAEYLLVWLVGLVLLVGSGVMQTGVAARAYVAFNMSERQAVRWLGESSDPIVVDSTFTASVAEPVYTKRLVLLALDQQHASEIAVRLAAEGFESLLLVSREQQQRLVFAPFRLVGTRRTMHTVVQQWAR